MNPRLEQVLLKISSEMTPEEIEKRSRVQKRGQFSEKLKEHLLYKKDIVNREV